MLKLQEHGILLEGMLLKPNMITPGADCPTKSTPAEIAWYTVRTLARTMVPSIPGVTFLSGGQSEEQASLNLNAMNKLDAIAKPWSLTFSFGRALQASCLKAWLGKEENVKAAQDALITRAKANGESSIGKYAGGTGDDESLYVKNYVY
jgi:fructose-bisphosphate aldolase class I